MTSHQITKVRRESKRRMLTVVATERLTPRMQRIHFQSPDMYDFASDAADDHVKLFFPDGAGGSDPASVTMRDYTPRKFDIAKGMLTIDFVLHEAGPATAWAMAAKAGDVLQVGGPRGSNVVADDFDWYLLIGDETALPAIGRRVEELRDGVPVTTLVVVDDVAEEQTFVTRAGWMPLWVHRAGRSENDAVLMQQVLENLVLPAGEGYIWIAAEVNVARSLRAYVKEKYAPPREWLKASGYWNLGAIAAHERIEDEA